MLSLTSLHTLATYTRAKLQTFLHYQPLKQPLLVNEPCSYSLDVDMTQSEQKRMDKADALVETIAAQLRERKMGVYYIDISVQITDVVTMHVTLYLLPIDLLKPR